MAGALRVKVHRVLLRADLPFLVDVNVYLVGAGREWVLVDSGYGREGMVDIVEKEVQRIAGSVANLKGILVTHAHIDHFGGATVLKRKGCVRVMMHKVGAPMLEDFRRLAEKYFGMREEEERKYVNVFLKEICGASETRVDETLEDGSEVEVAGSVLRAVHTPGHSPCHVCFYDPDNRVLFSGDLIISERSTWIGYPSGDVGLYLDSVRRLSKLKIDVIYPAHGGVIDNPAEKIKEVIRHKEERLSEVYSLLKEKPRTIAEIAKIIYANVPWPRGRWLERAIKAYIVELEKRRRVRRVKEQPEVYEAI